MSSLKPGAPPEWGVLWGRGLDLRLFRARTKRGQASASFRGANLPVNIARAPLLYAGAILDAFRRISLTVSAVSLAPRFHFGACMKSSERAGPGIRSEVGASFGRLSQVRAASGLGFAPRRGFAGPMPKRLLICCSDLAARSLASCFFRYSDFTPLS